MKEPNELLESDARTGCEVAVKALASAIPSLGGVLASLMSDLQNIRKEKRFVEFLEGMKSDLVGLNDRVNQEFVSKEDFLDIFEQTSKKIIDERQEKKREAFRNILANSMLSSNITYDEVEEYLTITETLRPEHLLVLKILKDPIGYDETTGNRVGKGGGFSASLGQIMRKLLPDWDESVIVEVLAELENKRFIKDMAKSLKVMMTDQGINHLTGQMTQKGMRFCDFVTSPKR